MKGVIDMAKQVMWNEIIYTEFVKLGMLNEFEREVLRTRIMGYSITKQAQVLNCSESTISRTVSLLKQKYDTVQPYSDKLPPRRSSKQEEWMDRN